MDVQVETPSQRELAKWPHRDNCDVVCRPEDLKAPEPQAAYAWWLRQRGERLMPHPDEINPAEIPRLLPHLVLLDVLGPPLDFFFRIEGETVQSTLGFRRMGHRMSELKSRYGRDYLKSFMSAARPCETKAPHAMTARLTGFLRGFYVLDIVMLPYSRDGESVHRILQCIGVTFDVKVSDAFRA